MFLAVEGPLGDVWGVKGLILKEISLGTQKNNNFS